MHLFDLTANLKWGLRSALKNKLQLFCGVLFVSKNKNIALFYKKQANMRRMSYEKALKSM